MAAFFAIFCVVVAVPSLNAADVAAAAKAF